MYLEDCIVESNIKVSEKYYLMRVKSEKMIEKTKPGQFFMLKLKNEIRILKRPISIHYVDKENKILEFYYEIKGEGTKEFSKLRKNEVINIQGALGNGFNTDIKNKKCIVIGGGMGIAPIKFLAKKLMVENEVIVLLGGRDKESIKITKNFQGMDIKIATDDGSVGRKGDLVEYLEEILKTEKVDFIQTCGPHKMMEKVGEVAMRNSIPCEISLEARMACGVKACVGCSIKTKSGMRRVCHDGPVFMADEVVEVELNIPCSCEGER